MLVKEVPGMNSHKVDFELKEWQILLEEKKPNLP